MKIISYDRAYRDDMIFMVRQAKDALGRKPGLNEDLLSIEDHYIQCGDGFWLAIAENAMKKAGKNVSRVHLGSPKEQWFESFQADIPASEETEFDVLVHRVDRETKFRM